MIPIRKLIVGIDPGTTTAVALLDIDSSLADVASRKDFSFSAVCDYIVSKGDPLIIATDKKSAPDFVKKIAATFGARIHVPKENMAVEQKETLTRKFSFANDHEQDALAAALEAKKHFSSFLEKIDTILERKGFAELKGDVKELLLKGEASNIEQALKMLAPEERKDTRIVSRLVDSKSILELRKQVERYEKENAQLRKKIAELEQKMKQLGYELKREEELRKKISGIIAKSRPVMKKETLPAGLEKDYYILVEYEPGADVRDKIVIVDKRADVAAVAKKMPKAIIAEKTEDADVPVLEKDSVAVKKVGDFLVAEKAAVDGAIKKNFISWLGDYKQRYETNFSKKFDQKDR
ncbi:MAG: DUF460 domain-containing protein [Candidatus Aenigmarchaeota archaeon]|nr:DUF460 domain-containing protein [Candidatus Aenigmarchaeota archaeon]